MYGTKTISKDCPDHLEMCQGILLIYPITWRHYEIYTNYHYFNPYSCHYNRNLLWCTLSPEKDQRSIQRAFGTPDITQAARQMKQEYSTTPKSVSAMTSLLLPKIVSDFPDFQYDEMKERAENVLTQYLRAVTEKIPPY